MYLIHDLVSLHFCLLCKLYLLQIFPVFITDTNNLLRFITHLLLLLQEHRLSIFIDLLIELIILQKQSFLHVSHDIWSLFSKKSCINQSQLQYFMSSVTKYLLLVPSAYILYCIYEDHQYQARKLAQQKSQQSQSMKSLSSRLYTCKTSMQMSNVFKKSFHYLRKSIVQPTRTKDEVLDCEILDSGQGSSLWIYPYSTRNLVNLTPYLDIENKKQGQYSIFFWYHVLTKQSLRLKDAHSEVEAVKSMIKDREKKCAQIAQRFDKDNGRQFQARFFECIRKSEGAVRLIEKELYKIKMIEEYEDFDI